MEDFDNLDLPNLDHWKSVMEFTAEQAALLLAMIDPLDSTLESVRRHRLPRWKHAHGHALGINSAIRQGLISPVVCKGYVWMDVPDNYGNMSLEKLLRVVKASDRDAEISLSDTIITRASLVGWIASESIQITRPHRLPSSQPEPSSLQEPITIESKPEPLALPRHGHTSEGLGLVDEAITQFWSTTDPEDPTTAPFRDDVIAYLKSRGASGNLAAAVDLILRPDNMRKARLKNRKVPTREPQ